MFVSSESLLTSVDTFRYTLDVRYQSGVTEGCTDPWILIFSLRLHTLSPVTLSSMLPTDAPPPPPYPPPPILNRSSAPSASTPKASAKEPAMTSVRDLPPPAAALSAVLHDRVDTPPAVAGTIFAVLVGCHPEAQFKAAILK